MSVNDYMDDLEMETQVMMVDGKPKTIKEILDSIQSDDKKERKLSEG